MQTHHRSLILAVVVFLVVQQANSEPKHYEFTVALWDNPENGVSYSFVENKSSDHKTLAIRKLMRSEVYQTRSLQFEIHRKGKEGVATRIPVRLNPGYQRTLILLMPKKKGFDHFHVDDSPGKLAYGSYLFCNLTKLNINGRLDDQNILLPAGSRVSSVPAAKEGNGHFLSLWHQSKGEKKILYRNTLTYNPNKYLIFFLASSEDRMGRLKLVTRGIVAIKPDGDSP